MVLVLVLRDLLPTSTKTVSAGPTCTHPWKNDFGFKINESVGYGINDYNYEQMITTEILSVCNPINKQPASSHNVMLKYCNTETYYNNYLLPKKSK